MGLAWHAARTSWQGCFTCCLHYADVAVQGPFHEGKGGAVGPRPLQLTTYTGEKMASMCTQLWLPVSLGTRLACTYQSSHCSTDSQTGGRQACEEMQNSKWKSDAKRKGSHRHCMQHLHPSQHLHALRTPHAYSGSPSPAPACAPSSHLHLPPVCIAHAGQQLPDLAPLGFLKVVLHTDHSKAVPVGGLEEGCDQQRPSDQQKLMPC